jgi:hypothetical protein
MNANGFLFGNDATLQRLQRWSAGTSLHDFSYPTLLTYKNINAMLSKKAAVNILEDRLILNPSPARKEVYFRKMPVAEEVSAYMQEGYACVLPEKLEDFPGSMKRTEVVYDLEEVFSPDSYPNAKKRSQRIRYPFTFLEKECVTIKPLIGSDDISKAVKLHDTWIQYKLDDPRVHQHSLSTARYKRCVELGKQYPEDVLLYGAWRNNELAAVRVIGVMKDRAYDLAFFSDYQNLPSQSTVYLNVAFMKLLKDRGDIRTLNAGLSAEKGLKIYKNHYPNSSLISYRYK